MRKKLAKLNLNKNLKNNKHNKSLSQKRMGLKSNKGLKKVWPNSFLHSELNLFLTKVQSLKKVLR